MQLKSPRKHKYNRKSIKAMDPNGDLPHPPPPPPVTALHVASVTWAGPAPNISHWTFDRDIVTPPALPMTLTINGNTPIGLTLLGPRLLELVYPLIVTAGAWHCPADAANIVSVDGYRLAAASGTVG